MKLADIKPQMVLKHISDYGVAHTPQKIIVLKINTNAQEHWEDGDSVYCEWFSKTGELHRAWLNHNRLEKW